MPLRVAPARAEISGSSQVIARVRARVAGAAPRIAWACSIVSSVSLSRLRQRVGSGARAGPGPRAHVMGVDRPAAVRADDDRIEHLAAIAVLEQHRPPPFAEHVRVAPANEREQHRLQVEALGREPILVAAWALLVRHAAQHPETHQLAQAVGEHVAGDAEAPLELLEPAHPQEAVAQDQDGPAVADHGDRASDRTGFALEVVPAQGSHSGPVGPRRLTVSFLELNLARVNSFLELICRRRRAWARPP